MEFIKELVQALYETGIYIHNSNDYVKLIIIIIAIGIYWKTLSKSLIKFTSWLGLKIFNTENSYLQSLFLNKKIIRILVMLLPLLFLNIILPQIEWTFSTTKYLQTIQNLHGQNGLGKSLTDLVINGNPINLNNSNVLQANQNIALKNAPFHNTGKLISNVLYLSNLFMFLFWLSNILSHTVGFFSNQEKYSKKPLHGFAQIIFIIFLIITIATVYAHYTDQSPLTLFTTLSVMSVAVFMTLKDIIMGVISTIIIMSTDLIKVGDWITNEKYNANGHVIEISLTTVKVMNFDKTISNIPTYSFISEGFQNQQEMINSGLRRVKQSIRIEPSSIKFLDLKELDKYKQIETLKSYIEQRQATYNKNNSNENIDYSIHLNGKQITNLDLYRKYIEIYLREHSLVYTPNEKRVLTKTNKVDTEPVVYITEGTKEGVGFEIYCFLKGAEQFKVYESQVTSIMTKMYASANFFDIKINC